jgi:shikimate kinase
MWVSFIGYLAVGKSTAAQRLAAATGRRAIDLDVQVVHEAGRDLAAIFDRGGPQEFRDRERRALLNLRDDEPLVVATGAGTVERADTLDLLRARGAVIWLDAPWDTLQARLRAPGPARARVVEHLGWEGLAALYQRRRPMYAAAAHLRLGTDRTEPDALTRLALARSLQWESRER